MSPSGRSFGSTQPLCGGGGSGGPSGRGPHPPGGSGGSGPGGNGDIPDDASGRGRMEPATIFFGLFVLGTQVSVAILSIIPVHTAHQKPPRQFHISSAGQQLHTSEHAVL